MVLSEHEALRHRFQGILSFMGQRGGKGKQAIKSAQSTNAVAKKSSTVLPKSGIKRRRKSNRALVLQEVVRREADRAGRQRPCPVEVPSLADWQADFLEIAADPQLRDVVILDAGGYSLTSLSSRWECIRTELCGRWQRPNRAGTGFLAHKSGESSGQYSLASRAREVHLLQSIDGRRKDAEVAGEIARWTQEIYTEPLQEVLSG